MTTNTIYLLHIQPAYKHARHYLGSTSDLTARLAAHRSGTGSPLCRAAVEAGNALILVRTWKGGRIEERKLHRRKNSPALCPLCQQETKP